MSGPLSTNLTCQLNGNGFVSCTDERLEQMPFFYGATEFFAKHVPGVKSLVNLSDASLGFTITNGTLYATNAIVSSDVLTIAATGTYDISKDDLAFTGNITLKDNKNFLMQLATSPIRWTGGKIFGFRIKGKIDDPSWSYEQNIIPSSDEIISRSKDIISLPAKIISPQKK